MDCKNCERPLRTDYSFCSNCGAKIIRHRLTFKNLWYDVTERYFNVDNTFFRTFWHLFTKPANVIDGYVKGVRKKYLNPISYLAIALTLSGVIIFLIRKFFDNQIDWGSLSSTSAEFGTKWKELTFDYSSLFFLMYIPILAFAAFLSFRKEKYNLTEYIVTYIYILAQYSILSFPISVLLLVIAPEYYLQIGTPFLAFILIYSIYVCQKINGYRTKKLIGKSLLYMLLSVIGYFGIVIGLMILLLIVGFFDLQDFVPPPK